MAVEQAALLRSMRRAALGWSVAAQLGGKGADERAVLIPRLTGVQHLDIAHTALDEAVARSDSG